MNLDDRTYILEHPDHGRGLTLETLLGPFRAPYHMNYIPLTLLSLRIDYALYGERPAGYLLTNVALHTASALLLFLALARMTGAVGRSAFVAAVFAVHPLHVESVAWASARKDALSGLFFTLALLAYARYAEQPRSTPRYAAVVACLGLGLLAKPTLVTLPFVLLLLDYWPLRRLRDPDGLREKLHMLALALAASAVAFFAQRAEGGMAHGDALPPGLRVLNAFESYATYVGQAVWPSGLAAYYPHPLHTLSLRRAAACALGLAGATGALLLAARTRPYAIVGWLWFLGTLVPTIGLVQVSLQARADRYMYIPLIGLAIAVGWGAVDALGRWRAGRLALPALACAVVGALAIASHRQVGTWRNTLALFERAAAVTRDNYFAEHGIAAVHLEAGRYAEAERHFLRAVQLEPRWLPPHRGLAEARYRQGDREGAVSALREALRFWPDEPEVHRELGALLLETGREAEARHHLARALAGPGPPPALRAR